MLKRMGADAPGMLLVDVRSKPPLSGSCEGQLRRLVRLGQLGQLRQLRLELASGTEPLLELSSGLPRGLSRGLCFPAREPAPEPTPWIPAWDPGSGFWGGFSLPVILSATILFRCAEQDAAVQRPMLSVFAYRDSHWVVGVELVGVALAAAIVRH